MTEKCQEYRQHSSEGLLKSTKLCTERKPPCVRWEAEVSRESASGKVVDVAHLESPT